MMVDASDMTTRRIKYLERRKQVYWWNSTLQELRKECIRARQIWTRAKKKQADTRLSEELKKTEKNLQAKEENIYISYLQSQRRGLESSDYGN